MRKNSMAAHASTNENNKSNKWPVLIACGIGNIIEWYDFVIFGTLSTFIAGNFFPSQNALVSILSTFAAFGIAFLFRPLGGILFGHIGDRLGRRFSLASVILMTSGATFLLGFIPSYNTIGVLASILLVVLRCIQGLGAGGEMSGTASYLIEYAPAHKKGLYASSVGSTVILGILIGVVLTTIISAATSDAFMAQWGWRIMFWFAGPLGLAGLYIRTQLSETSEFEETKAANALDRRPLFTLIKEHKRSAAASIVYTAGHAAGVYFLIAFMINYLESSVNVPQTVVLVTNMIAVACVVVVALISGHLSDRYGRRPVALTTFLLYMVLILPAFFLVSTGTYLGVLFGQLCLAIPAGLTSGVVTILQVELFPANIRYSGAGATYNLGQIIGGAFTPFIATWIVAVSSHLMAFVYLYAVIVTALVGTSFLLKETHPLRSTKVDSSVKTN